MDDQFPGEENSIKKVDHVFSEGGPGGEEAANFRAPRQENPGGSSGESPQQPETEKPTPTEASKGFLGKWGDAIRNFYDQIPLQGQIASVFASAIGLGGALFAGGKEGLPGIISDIAEGNYPRAAARGITTGLLAVNALQSVNAVARGFGGYK